MKTIIRAFVSPSIILGFLALTLILTLKGDIKTNAIIGIFSGAIALLFAFFSSSKASQYTSVSVLVADSMADSVWFAMSVAIAILWNDWAVRIYSGVNYLEYYSVLFTLIGMSIIIFLESIITLKNGAESLLRQNPINIS